MYSSARPTVLKILDAVHHSSLRLATGAFKSSPISSILVDCGELSLLRRREQLLLPYATRIKSQPCYLVFKIIFGNPNWRRYQERSRCTAPLGIRLQWLLSSLNLSLPPISPLYPPVYPPWTLGHIKTYLDLTILPKKSTNIVVWRQVFGELLSRINPDVVVYTDGSKLDNKVGCAFTINDRTYMFGLPYLTSVFNAELYAINKAINIISPRFRNIIICSDSLSALQALEDIYSSHAIVTDIFTKLAELRLRGTQVGFCWVPGHVGIEGNERVDAAAKEACDQPPFTKRIVSGDFVCFIKQFLRNEWQDEWRATVDNKLRHIKDTVLPWDSSSRKNRREEVVLCRLRLGHSHVTHAYLMSSSGAPMCERCDCRLTVRHILVDCVRYAALRRRFKIEGNIRYLLGNDAFVLDRMFLFLRGIRMINLI